MITICALPRPFEGFFNIIQRNAIKSWCSLRPKCQIILFGNEIGTAEIARELDVCHIPDIKTNEFGTPLLDDILAKAKKAANFEIVAKVNADNILLQDFLEGTKLLQKFQKTPFLMVGQRWDLDVNGPIQFDNYGWGKELMERVKKEGKRHGLSGMDYWIFPRDLKLDTPSFTEGRFTTDGWLVYKMKTLKIPVIDATKIINLVHQNHPYPQMEKPFYETERRRNIKLAGGLAKIMTLRDADWILTSKGLKRPPFWRRIFVKLSFFPFWGFLLSIKRKLRH